VFVVLLLALFGGAVCTPLPWRVASLQAPRVINGIVADEGAWPAQLSLQRLRTEGWGHTCGGTLLSVNYAMTAAHCVDGAGPADRLIQAGVNRRDDPSGQIKTLSVIKQHEDYSVGNGFPNDIAVMQFESPITLGPKVQLGLLPSNGEDFIDSECFISGWGRTDTSSNIPNSLRQAAVSVLSNAECQQRIGFISTIFSTHICIYDRSNVHGACNGDSGGPINCRADSSSPYKQVGVASWVVASSGNCLTSYPSVYARVSSYLDWIEVNTS